MKTTLYIILLGLLFSCVRNRNSDNLTNDTLRDKIDAKEKERSELRSQIKNRSDLDSLRLEGILTDAIEVSTKNILQDKFYKKYEVPLDREDSVTVEVNFDKHFTKLYPHLIIRRFSPNSVYIDIFSKNGNEFEKVISYEQWTMTYVNDTIQDINGDDINDFVVNWYAANGCCLKAFSNVFVLRQDKESFSSSIEFVNPTFSPAEKIVRGICYGHPGETEMYKYKWTGEKIETLEYISFEKDKKGEKTGKFIISKDRPINGNLQILARLDSIPNDYKKIKGYDWFLGEGYN